MWRKAQMTPRSIFTLPLRTLERATGSVRDVAAFADWRVHAELELLGHCDFDLGVFTRGPSTRTRSMRPFGPTMASCSLQAYWPGCERSACLVS